MLKNTRSTKKSTKKKSKGFTLVELIVVVVILAIIIGVAITGIYKYVQQSRINTDINNANAMQKVLGTLSTDKEANQSLSSLVENEALTITWKDAQKIENGKISAAKNTEENAVYPKIPPLIIDKIGELFSDGLPSSKTGNYFHLIIKKLDDTDIQYKVVIGGSDPSNPDGSDPSNPSKPDGSDPSNPSKPDGSDPSNPDNEEQTLLAPGLYNEEDILIRSWDSLLEFGFIHVEGNSITEVKPFIWIMGDDGMWCEEVLAKKLIIKSGITTIQTDTFKYCTNLTSVTIPDTVTSIGTDAFKDVPHIYYNGSASGKPWGALAIN